MAKKPAKKPAMVRLIDPPSNPMPVRINGVGEFSVNADEFTELPQEAVQLLKDNGIAFEVK